MGSIWSTHGVDNESQLCRTSYTLGFRHSLYVEKVAPSETEEPQRCGHHSQPRRSLADENRYRAGTQLEAATHPEAAQEAGSAEAHANTRQPGGRDAAQDFQPRHALEDAFRQPTTLLLVLGDGIRNVTPILNMHEFKEILSLCVIANNLNRREPVRYGSSANQQ